MSSKVFVSSNFRESCEPDQLDKLISDFKSYKLCGEKPEIFGRDAPYEFPSSVRQAELQHIHVKDSSSKRWNLEKLDFYKTSDSSLIYCKGFMNSNYYCLLGFLVNAHLTCRRNPTYLLHLAEIAEGFRSKF